MLQYDFNKWSNLAQKQDFHPICQEDVKWLADNTVSPDKSGDNQISGFVKRLRQDTSLTSDQLAEMLTEIQDLIEQYPRNTMYLCKSNGMFEVIALICSHENKQVRKLACSILSATTANQPEIQAYATKSGALNLTKLVQQESNQDMKEAFLTSLSQFLKANNFDGKKLFVRDFSGLDTMSKLVCDDHASLRLKKRALFLLSDLLAYDEHIMGTSFFVRTFFTHRNDVIDQVIRYVRESDLDFTPELQLREYSLNILYYLYLQDKEKL